MYPEPKTMPFKRQNNCHKTSQTHFKTNPELVTQLTRRDIGVKDESSTKCDAKPPLLLPIVFRLACQPDTSPKAVPSGHFVALFDAGLNAACLYDILE